MLTTAAPAAADEVPGPAGGRAVVMVANAEGGTVDVVDARTFRVLRTLDVLPDGPDATLGQDDAVQALLGQSIVEAAGGRNYAQDQDISPDGRTLYVSRGHRGDVAAFDLASSRLLWKAPIPGVRSDHMTISPDGRMLYVSALTDNRLVTVDTATHRIVGSLATGQWPHDNHVSEGGERLYNASIGTIVVPSEVRGLLPPAPYVLTIADARSLRPLRRFAFRNGIRPIVVTRDERRLFAQLSYLHGIVEFDLEDGRVAREVELPVDPGVTEDDFDFEAPHHGLAISPDERTLCAAGRASDYVALVSTATLQPEAIIEVGDAPGWAATGPDGRHCFVPNTRADTLSVISFGRRAEIARIAVGDGPKQIEPARIPEAVLCAAPSVPGCSRAIRLERRCVSRGRLALEVTGDVDAALRVTFRLGGRVVGRAVSPPFRRLVTRRTLARHPGRASATVEFADETRRLGRTIPRCARDRR